MKQRYKELFAIAGGSFYTRRKNFLNLCQITLLYLECNRGIDS
ncbi:hypothetical protein lbkm_1168 [Lachnospiraceae bacterium KM106-2]|nr:hypothetical protein lbkm_1168 [Lachnospiraceae bacterium KM106-2]